MSKLKFQFNLFALHCPLLNGVKKLVIIILNLINFFLHPYLTMSHFFNHGFSLIIFKASFSNIYGSIRLDFWQHWDNNVIIVWDLASLIILNLCSNQPFSASSFTSRTLYWKIDVWKSESLLKTVCLKGCCCIIFRCFSS